MGIIAAAEAATSKSSSSSYTFLLLIVLVFVGFYFLLIRPQRRRQQAVQQQQRTVAPGARVRTTAGMYATVVAVDGDDVILEVAPGVDVRYMKRSVMEVITPGEAEATEDVEDAHPDGYADDDAHPDGYADDDAHPDGYADDDLAASDDSQTTEASDGTGPTEDDKAESRDGVAGSGNAF
jgi:preprotein translocase subunit YajC